MNLILIREKYSPAVIRNEQRRQYLDTLRKGDKGKLIPFIELAANSLINTQKVVIKDLNNK